MKRRNKVICGVLALVSVTQMSFYDKLSGNEKKSINSYLGSYNNSSNNSNLKSVNEMSLDEDKDANDKDNTELEVSKRTSDSKSKEDLEIKEKDLNSKSEEKESNIREKDSNTEINRKNTKAEVDDKDLTSTSKEDNLKEDKEKNIDNSKIKNSNTREKDKDKFKDIDEEDVKDIEDEENDIMDIDSEVTTGAAILLEEQSPELISLNKKINEVNKKLAEDKEKGINYAKERLSDLYLDGVKDDDNLNDLNRIINEAKVLINNNEKNKDKINEYTSKIEESYKHLRKIEKYKSFSGTNGDVWKDTNGVKIQAHGGQVQKINGKWWWYGEDKTKGYRSNGISAYSSDDLYNWTFEGYVMRDLKNREQLDDDPYFSELYKDYSSEEKDNVYLCINDSSSVIERPKVIYNEKTGKYVMWFHDDGPTKEAPDSNYAAASAGVCVSDSPNGPFKFIDRYRLNVCPEGDKKGEGYEKSAGFARDMDLFVDDDKTAYIVYSSEENRTMFISKLNDNYTYLSSNVDEAKIHKDFVRLFPGAQREAPALFKYNNKYYMINSGATGWDPNEARYWVSDDILGEWKDMGNPCVNDNSRKTFETQSTHVIPVDKKRGKYIFMADRWKSSDLGDSRYVWLPLEFGWNGKLSIRDYKNWNASDLNDKYSVKVNSKLKDIYTDTKDLPKTLNVGVYEGDELVNKDIDVTWDVGDLKPLTKTTVKGKLKDLDREISTDVISIPKNLKYFIDCGNKESDVFNIVKNKSKSLINNVCDQKYVNGSWGYTGIIGKDIDYKDSDSKDSFDAGWWAYEGKTIDYKIHLKSGKYNLISGFYEWWNTSRNMNITLSYVNDYGRKVSERLGEFTNRDQKTLEYEFYVPKEEDVTISVASENYKKPDPILSWLAVQSLDGSSNDEDTTEKKDTTDSNDKKEDNLNQNNKDNNSNTDKKVESSNSGDVENKHEDTINKLPVSNTSSSSSGNSNGTVSNSASSGSSSSSKSSGLSSSSSSGNSGSSSSSSSSSSGDNNSLESSSNSGGNANSSIIAEESSKENTSSNNGWNKTSDGKLKYFENGKIITGWKSIDSKWYYLGADGERKIGWQKINDKWFYLNDDGDMASGWKNVNNKWYYLGTDGDMKVGWQKINDKWYYLNANGDMASGWKYVNNNWYYLNYSGEMKTGWNYINNKWYYFYANGNMASNTSINGYKLSGNGEMI